MSRRKSRHAFRPWPITPKFRCWFLDRTGDVRADSRGRLYRVGPAGNLIRTEARRG